MGIVTQRSMEMEGKEKISAMSSAKIRDQIGTEFLDMTIQHIQLLKQEEHVDAALLREVRESVQFIFQNF